MRILLLLFSLSLSAQAQTSVQGLKFPNHPSEGSIPVPVTVPAGNRDTLGGFNELLPFVTRAPVQENAGTCLYMSLTGVAEWWLARLHPDLSRAPDGPLDLSERFLVNFSGSAEAGPALPNWKTDSIELFNRIGGMPLNADYRFTKGWHRISQGRYLKAAPEEPGATYSSAYNWVDERRSIADRPLVPMPRFRREVLLADPEGNPWNTGVAPTDLVDRIKTALRENKAPVHVIYNHFGYWHATMIVGFDDEYDNRNCRFVRDFLTHLRRQPNDSRAQVALRKTEAAIARSGGCRPRGVFYVRDSIYEDRKAPVYDYDPNQVGEELHYGKDVVLLEYDWITFMANHVSQVLLE